MLNYELCLKLKNAGFHQGGSGAHYKPPREEEYVPRSQHDFRGHWAGNLLYRQPEHVRYVYEPTLSELIEACKDRFSRLNRVSFEIWEARGYKEGCEVSPGDQRVCEGETPIEAVANLWLEINQQNHVLDT